MDQSVTVSISEKDLEVCLKVLNKLADRPHIVGTMSQALLKDTIEFVEVVKKLESWKS